MELEELNKKVENDLKTAKKVDYADSKEDVEAVTALISKLQKAKEGIEANLLNGNATQKENETRLALFKSLVEKTLDETQKEILKKDITSLEKVVDENKKILDKLTKSNKILDRTLERLQYSIIDGKAKFSEDAITFAYLFLLN